MIQVTHSIAVKPDRGGSNIIAAGGASVTVESVAEVGRAVKRRVKDGTPIRVIRSGP